MYRFLTLALLLAATACAAVSEPRSPFEGSGRAKDTPSSTATYTVNVYNPSFTEVTIFAISAYGTGARVRVGRLGSAEERAFEFRMTTAQREVRFELDYFAGPTCFSQPILLTPGDQLELQLPAEPRNSLNCRR